MKALCYNGRELEFITNAQKPVPKEKESLVKILLSAVCNTDKEVRKGYKPDFKGIMGHEFVGVVEASNDTSLIGKRVVGELNAGCKSCIYCKTGRSKHCTNRRVLGLHHKDGCFADYMTIETELLHVVPEHLPTETAIFTEPLAAALEIPTMLHLAPDKNVAVLGDGRLAYMIAQVIALSGAELTVVGRHEEKLEQFSFFCKTTKEILPEAYEVVIDATGSKTGILTAATMVRKMGTIVLKSTYAGNVELNMSDFVVNEITLIGSRCGPFPPALNLLSKGLITLPSIELYPLERYEDAFTSQAFKAGFHFL